MAQRSVEILIGRLITDEAFRFAFCRNAAGTLREFMEAGFELTSVEVAALCATSANAWREIATHIDPRLHKVWLRGPAEERS